MHQLASRLTARTPHCLERAHRKRSEHQVTTPPCSHQSSGQVERWHHTLFAQSSTHHNSKPLTSLTPPQLKAHPPRPRPPRPALHLQSLQHCLSDKTVEQKHLNVKVGQVDFDNLVDLTLQHQIFYIAVNKEPMRNTTWKILLKNHYSAPLHHLLTSSLLVTTRVTSVAMTRNISKRPSLTNSTTSPRRNSISKLIEMSILHLGCIRSSRHIWRSWHLEGPLCAHALQPTCHIWYICCHASIYILAIIIVASWSSTAVTSARRLSNRHCHLASTSK